MSSSFDQLRFRFDIVVISALKYKNGEIWERTLDNSEGNALITKKSNKKSSAS